MTDLTVRQLSQARSVVALAFENDPLIEWIFPDADTRLEYSAAWWGVFMEQYVLHARIDVLEIDDEVVAVAMWRLPFDEFSIPQTLPTTGGLMIGLLGLERTMALGEALQTIGSRRPKPPFAYLQTLAVAPDCQGTGLGGQVIAPGLQAADDAGLVAYLETMKAENLPFYARHGFDISAEFDLPADGPHTWTMQRPVR